MGWINSAGMLFCLIVIITMNCGADSQVPGFNCDFEKDLCGWNHTLESETHWKRKRGIDLDDDERGPKYDHTFKSNTSYYLLFRSEAEEWIEWPWGTGGTEDRSTIVSPTIDGTLQQCFTFWYHMFGSKVGELSVYYMSQTDDSSLNKTEPVWVMKNPHGDHWNLVSINYEGGAQSIKNVVIEAYANFKQAGDIAIDDISQSMGPCEDPNFASVTCDFEEEHICGYTSDPTGQFNWLRHKGRTQSAQTGPSVDHTTGTASGYYMYTEVSRREKGDKARLLSPIQSAKSGKCLVFWYHSYGLDVGDLNVYSQPKVGGFYKQLWSMKRKNLGNKWFIARAPTDYDEDFRIIFEGVVDDPFAGDLAIDDIYMHDMECEHPIDCDFEDSKFDYCSWQNAESSVDDFDWELFSSYSDGRFGIVPDHTLDDEDGHLALANDADSNKFTRLYSEFLQPKVDLDACLLFYYYFGGTSDYRLEVKTAEFNKTENLVWSLNDKDAVLKRYWFLGRVSIKANDIHRVYFDAYTGTSKKDFVGIDGIQMKYRDECKFYPPRAQPGGPTTPQTTDQPTTTQPSIIELDCDFEESSSPCKWFNNPSNSNGNWTVKSGREGTQLSISAPSGDHTTGTLDGRYLTLQDVYINNSSKVGWHSPNMNGTKCLEFWYYIYASKTGKMKTLLQQESGYATELWTSSSTFYTWKFAQMNAKPVAMFGDYYIGIYFETNSSSVFNGFVGIDDIIIHEGQCVPVSDSQLCTFENNDFCQYTNDPNAEFSWRLGNSSSQSSLTGPSSDHTNNDQSGIFAFIDASKQKKGDKARLISPVQNKTAGSCIQFFYSAKGSDIGELVFYTKINSEMIKRSIVFGSLITNQWYLSELTIKSLQFTWQGVFEGVVGDGPNGNIAIDDIKISRGECRHFGDCDFEDNNLCDYTNSPSSQIDWIPKRSLFLGPSQIPPVDHTLQSVYGYYAQFITSQSSPNSIGQLISQPLEPVMISRSKCIKFFYFMYRDPEDTYSSTLNVKLLDIKTGTTTLLWSLRYSQGNSWKEGRLVYESSDQHQIIFEGVRGNGQGDIALDDIKFVGICVFYPSEANPNATVTTTLAPTIFTTPTRPTTTYSFVSKTSVDCSFDADFCTWTNDPTADLNWTRTNSDLSQYSGPQYDHTYGNGTGSFAFLDVRNGVSLYNQNARLMSETIKLNSSECFEFYYYMNGLYVNSLNVYLKENNRLGNVVWTRTRAQGSSWLRAEVRTRGLMYQEFQIVFEATTLTSRVSPISIDDVRLLSECSHKSDRFCDFENPDICGYTLEQGDIMWRRASGNSPDTIITADHTLGTSSGHFLFSLISAGTLTKTARVYSNPITPNGEQCIEFFYNKDIRDTADLHVLVKQTGQLGAEVHLWSLPADATRYSWRIVQIPVINGLIDSTFQVIFEHEIAADTTGKYDTYRISIDDVFIRDQSCLPSGDCDFENGYCTWTKEVMFSRADWLIGNGKMQSQSPLAPSKDHSLGKDYGSFLYAESTSTFKNTPKLTSDVFPPTSPRGRCLTFWFYITGVSAGSLEFSLLDLKTNLTTPIWKSGSSNYGRNWNFGSVGFYTSHSYVIVLQGYSSNLNSFLAIDDIIFKESEFCSVDPVNAKPDFPGFPLPTKPPTTTKVPTSTDKPPLYDCDFETGFCNWENDPMPLEWKRTRGSTSTPDTGPSFDHTLGNSLGYYIYMDSYFSVAKNRARLVSPTLIPNSYCLSFFYHMRGADIDSLNVISSNPSNVSLLWTKKGNQGNVWINGRVNLEIEKDSTIIFEATRGTNINGDIALDDISIESGICPSNVFFNCDFEHPDICNFTTDPINDWTRNTGAQDLGYGPPVDHTTNTPNGHYMAYVDYYTGKTSRLISPSFKFSDSGYCLTWWYAMNLGSLAKLSVYLKIGNRSSIYWRFGEPLGTMWNAGQLTIPKLSISEEFRVVFEARSAGFGTDITIDDVSLEYGPCTITASCTFEDYDYCNWYNVQDGRDRFDWTFGSGPTPAGATGPIGDHTLGTSLGVYMYIEAARYRKGQNAIFESNLMLPTPTQGVCFDFWYHMHGNGMGTLNVYTYSSNGRTLIWTQSGNKPDAWFNGQMPIFSARSYRIAIEAIRGKSESSDIAIDDLELIERACTNSPDNSYPPLVTTAAPATTTTTVTMPPMGEHECNFEFSACQWFPPSDSTIKLARVQGKEGNVFPGPLAADHTTGTSDGWYLTASFDNRKSNDTLRLSSFLFKDYNCLQFYYISEINFDYKFSVHLTDGDQTTEPIWSRSNLRGSFWRIGRVDLKYTDFSTNLVVIFDLSGSLEKGTARDIIALDDLSFTKGFCYDSSEINELCTFSDSTMCKYQFSDGDFKWRLFLPTRSQNELDIDQAKDNSGPLPIYDHTSEGTGSGYVYVASKDVVNGSTASMISPTYTVNESVSLDKKCLEFYYYLQGSHAMALNVQVLPSNSFSKYLIWSRSNDHSQFWWKGEIEVKLTKEFKIYYEATVLNNTLYGLAGLDDIILRDGACAGSAEICDFEEKDFCNWKNAKETDDIDWVIITPSTEVVSTVPTFDHTLLTSQGSYMSIRLYLANEGDRAELISEPMEARDQGCLEFWYYLYGFNPGIINIYLNESNSSKQKLWSLTGTKGLEWYQGHAPYRTNSEHQLIIEGVVEYRFGRIAIDDVLIRTDTCKIQPADAAPQIEALKAISCDFENQNLCLWKSMNDSKLEWTVQANASDQFSTSGPQSGAAGTTFYAVVSNLRLIEGGRARLYSPIVAKANDDEGYCLSFYFNMWGVNSGALVLSASPDFDFNESTTIFMRNGSQGYSWVKQLIRIDRDTISHDFSLVFDAYILPSGQGDIAIDEVTLSLGYCPTSRTCDFEQGYCNWVNDTTGDFYWLRKKGKTETGATGPSIDHTTQSSNGYYIFMESSRPLMRGQKARIISPTYPATNSNSDCFKFWYHLYGNDIGTLNVYTRQSQKLDKLLWTRQNNFGDMWRFAQVSVQTKLDFEIVLEGVIDSWRGDIAVDDVEIENDACPTTASCDFEKDLCGYYNTKVGDVFDWFRGRGEIFGSTGPNVDHTTMSVEGFYMFNNAETYYNYGDNGFLISEVFNAPQAGCLNWYMFLFGFHIGNLTVYQRERGKNLVELWHTEGDRGRYWDFGQVTIPPTTNFFEIIFEATVTGGGNGNIGLDDISYLPDGTCEYFASTTTPMPTRPPEPNYLDYSCDFETVSCFWSLPPNSQWVRKRASDGTKYGTAPMSDVTKQNALGYYAYHGPNTESLKDSSLKSPVIQYAQRSCFEFWYQLSANKAKLTLALRNQTYTSNIWTRESGSAQDNTWIHTFIDLEANLNGKWLEFDGDVPSKYSGFTAVDDIYMRDGACPPSPLCDFETDEICGYVNDVSATIKWIRTTSQTSTPSTGPSFDHTLQTSQGHYMYIESSFSREGEKARLISPKITPNFGGVCVTFWYHCYGADIGTLNVYSRVGFELSNALWSISGDQGNTWRVASLTIDSTRDFEIVFEAIAGDGVLSDIAIDDVLIDLKGSCRSRVSCTFEDSMCQWSHENDQESKFYRIAPVHLPSLDPENMIKTDVTTQTEYGHLLWLMASSESVQETATIYSETILAKDYKKNTCLTFAAVLGPNSKLTVYRKFYQLPEMIEEFSINGPGGGLLPWTRYKVPLSVSLSNYEFYIEAIVGKIGLDDIMFYDQDCSSVDDSPKFKCTDGKLISAYRVCNFIQDCSDGGDEVDCGACDFENSTCKYENYKLGPLQWERVQARLAQNGPKVDSSLNPLGHYVYLRNHADGGSSTYAPLSLKQKLRRSSPTCQIQFYYHMFGRSDNLEVVLREPDGGMIPIFSLSGDSGDNWNMARVPLGQVAGEFTIDFDGKKKVDQPFSDLAIDDISLVDCLYPQPRASCPLGYFTCDRKACIRNDKVCDMNDDCGDNSDEKNCDGYKNCNFELDSTCDWEDDPNADIRWELHRAQWAWQGPNRDHTLGLSQGHYLGIQSYESSTGEKARLISPVLHSQPFTERPCELRFFYFLSGDEFGELNVYVREAIGEPEKVLFSKKTSPGRYWERADIYLYKTTNFELIIEGVIGEDPYGTISIDDVSLTPECLVKTATLPVVTTKEITTTTPRCGHDSFECVSSNQCIPANKVCDFVKDCSDNSDETSCGECDFDRSSCGWTDIDSYKFKWIRNRGPSFNPAGPTIDHTSNSSTGGYMGTYLDPNMGTFSFKATLTGPKLQGLSEYCKLSFWLFMNRATSWLEIKYRNGDGALQSLLKVDGDQGNYWVNYIVDVGERKANGSFVIDAKPAYTDELDYGDVAIDDTKYIDCSPSSFVYDKSLDCDFEEDFCDYLHDTTGQIQWERKANGSVSTASEPSGPLFDHTTGTGYYAHFQAFNLYPYNKTGRFFSSIQKNKINASYCFSFWYHMFGPAVNTLKLYLDELKPSSSASTIQRQLIWQKFGPKGNKWFNAQRTINTTNPWRIVFEGTVGRTIYHNLALDDLSLTSGNCEPPRFCDFDYDLCGFNIVKDHESSLTWIRGMPESLPQLVDHSSSSRLGSVVYAEFNGVPIRSKTSLAFLIHQVDHTLECVKVWYVIKTDSIDAVELAIARYGQGQDETIVTQEATSTNNLEWRLLQTSFFPKYPVSSVVIEARAKTGSSAGSLIAVDDVSVQIGDCKPKHNCDFEDFDICNWEQLKTDKFDWLLNRGITETAETGPHQDHTLGTEKGVYAFVESSAPYLYRDNAILASAYIDAVKQGCFELYYFMNGESVYQLNIYQNVTTNVTLLDRIEGDKGYAWFHYLKNVTGDAEFKILVEGVVGSGYRGDIAIDDLSYSTSACGDVVKPTSYSTRSTKPNPGVNVIQCDFDQNSLCYWSNDPSGQFSWELRSGQTPTFLTGPSADYTSQNKDGYYAFIETSPPRQPNEVARISSMFKSVSFSGSCFKFYYHMFGSDINMLRVYFLYKNVSDTSAFGKPAWQKYGNQGNQWLFGHVFVPYSYYDVRFMIEGVVGKGPYGDIAIDGIDFTNGDCPLRDECDFESSDLCGFKANTTWSSKFQWEREQGSESEPDHSYGSSLGHYMVAKSLSPHNSSQVARLLMAPSTFPPKLKICLNFWYQSSGNIRFNVRTFANGKFSEKAAYQAYGDLSFGWALGRVTLEEITQYSVYFEANDLGSEGRDGSVKIDDVSYTYNECDPVASCSFEQGTCGYNPRQESDFDWVVLPGTFATIQNIWAVPSTDHTTGTAEGRYLYLDTSAKKPGQAAVLESEVIREDSGEKCLSFYLRTNADNDAGLWFRLNDKVTGDIVIIYMGNAEDTNDQWVLRQAPMSNYSRPYTLWLEGIVGEKSATRKGMLAVDDINVYEGQCKNIPPTVPPVTTTTTQAVDSTTSGQTVAPVKCYPGYCQNGARCTVQDNKLKCSCRAGFSGDRCEKIVKLPSDDSPNDVGVVLGVVIPCIVILAILGFVGYRYHKVRDFKAIFKFKSADSSYNNLANEVNDEGINILNPLFDANDNESGIQVTKVKKSSSGVKTYSTLE